MILSLYFVLQMSYSQDIEIEMVGAKESDDQALEHSNSPHPSPSPSPSPREKSPHPHPSPPPMQNGSPGTPPSTLTSKIKRGTSPPMTHVYENPASNLGDGFTALPDTHLSAPPSPNHHPKVMVISHPASACSSSDEEKPSDHVPSPKTVSTPNIHTNSLTVDPNGTSVPVKRSVSASPSKRPLGMSKMEVKMRGLSGYDNETYSDSDLMGKLDFIDVMH